jgi:glucokinase
MARNDQPYLGIDLGGTNIQAGLLDGHDKLIVTDRLKTKADGGEDQVVSRIVKLIHTVIDKAGVKLDDVAGLGIGAPGAVNHKKGVVINAVNLRWTDFPLGKLLEKELGIPVAVDNDVNVGTWGEYMAGAGKGYDDLMGIFIGTGIGGGFVLGGELYHGALMTAGEIGHTVINADSGLGRRTVENLASRTSIVNQLKQLILSNHPSVIGELTKGDLDKVRSKILAQAFEQEDELTLEVIGHAAHYIAVTIANAVTLLSLPCVVVGGGLTEALQKDWIELIRDVFEEYVFPPELSKCKIVVSQLGDDAGIIGAALLAKQRLEKD